MNNARWRALVLDDEPHIGTVVKMKLEEGSFVATLALDGMTALRLLRENGPFDVVTTDWMLDQSIPAEHVVRAIRNGETEGPSGTPRDVPIIVISAICSILQDVEITAQFTKPFSPKRLLAFVTHLLEGYELGQNTPDVESTLYRVGQRAVIDRSAAE